MVQKDGRIPTFTMKTCISEKRAIQQLDKVVFDRRKRGVLRCAIISVE